MFFLLLLTILGLTRPTLENGIDPLQFGGFSVHMPSVSYHVSIRNKSLDDFCFGFGFYCSGTLISPKFVLTAGHCLYYGYDPEAKKIDASEIQVVGGHSSIYVRNNDTFVSDVFTYKMTGTTFLAGDPILALLMLTTPATASTVSIISVPVKRFMEGDTCILTGWRTTHTFQRPTSKLRASYVQADQNCYGAASSFIKKYNGICIHAKSNSYDKCVSDVGSPLVCDSHLHGITYQHDKRCYEDYYSTIHWNVYHQSNDITRSMKKLLKENE